MAITISESWSPPWANASIAAMAVAMSGPIKRDDFEQPRQDRDPEGVREVEDRTEGDVRHGRHEGDQGDLAAEPLAEDVVDAAEQLDRAVAVPERQDLDRPVPEHRAVHQEVERHDQGQQCLEERRSDLGADMNGIARRRQDAEQPGLELPGDVGDGDRLPADHDRVPAHELAEERRERVRAGRRQEPQLVRDPAARRRPGSRG